MSDLRVGRNDICPCGSGQKFKKCCLLKQSNRPPTAGVLRPSPATGFHPRPTPPLETAAKPVPPGKVEQCAPKVIKTTFEHPFYVYGKGWTPLQEIKPGDWIRTDDGWIEVGKIEDPGRYETVYNLRVADTHTYFVGDEDWGFGVWAHNADYGEVERPGFFGRLVGRRPKIVRDADIVAATETLPPGARVQNADPNGNWVVYEMPNGAQQVRFRAREAWLGNEPTPTPNRTDVTSATVHTDGRVVVTEGLHRTRAMARERVLIDPRLGGVEKAPGWLDFAHDPAVIRDTASARAISQMLGGDFNAPFVPAR